MNIENNLIIKQAEVFYDVQFVKEVAMGYTGNRVFEVEKEGERYILRASKYKPESEKYIEFELKWMAYLANHLDNIVKPQRSIKGNLYEIARLDVNSYILCLFEKASGKIVDVNNPMEFNETLFFNLGKLMGKMHRLTRAYEGNIRIPEFEWNSPATSWRFKNLIEDEAVRQCQQKYHDEICLLPIDQDSYGIIHYDIHTDNFFVDKENIKLFDFNACQFNWYAADIASALFFLIQKGAGPLTYKSEEERTNFAETCFIAYLNGYLLKNNISEYWIKKIDLFMKYQMADEYIAGQNFWPENLAHLREWYLNWHKERITSGASYAFIDYDKILSCISNIKS